MLKTKEFNEKLHLDNFKMLEEEFQNAKKDLENSMEELDVNHLKLKYPIYFDDNNLLIVKFPTFKVRIINSTRTEENLKSILNKYSYFSIYEEGNVVLKSTLKQVQATAIYCFKSNLKDNEELAENIMDCLKKNNIKSERHVTYGCYPIPIEYTNEEKTRIKIIKDIK